MTGTWLGRKNPRQQIMQCWPPERSRQRSSFAVRAIVRSQETSRCKGFSGAFANHPQHPRVAHHPARPPHRFRVHVRAQIPPPRTESERFYSNISQLETPVALRPSPESPAQHGNHARHRQPARTATARHSAAEVPEISYRDCLSQDSPAVCPQMPTCVRKETQSLSDQCRQTIGE
ncbi:MAG: hypothetical protein AW09_002307 [Candidatus Accumulibacter phosphatis]|uniref:Uncharacterized protein n=1 Tax=Candidatus Accumulibacter phosphatis TaxID=327160 RepID=A0A080LV44_9PROT|nr:MAG: hypothetical protein AW09_002307 [Candidatus Accumulibacter phosphatis]